MAKAIMDLRDALSKIEAIHDETWTKDNFNVELTRALTTLENARMEWNAARLKLPALSGQAVESAAAAPTSNVAAPSPLATHNFRQLCRMGLALTWPLAAVALLALALLAVVVLRH